MMPTKSHWNDIKSIAADTRSWCDGSEIWNEIIIKQGWVCVSAQVLLWGRGVLKRLFFIEATIFGKKSKICTFCAHFCLILPKDCNSIRMSRFENDKPLQQISTHVCLLWYKSKIVRFDKIWSVLSANAHDLNWTTKRNLSRRLHWFHSFIDHVFLLIFSRCW